MNFLARKVASPLADGAVSLPIIHADYSESVERSYARTVDFVVRGATVYDGTGGPARVCDVGVSDGRISGVGDLGAARPGTSIAGGGLALAPGFIDVHSHDDFAVFLTPEMDFKVGQGVTSVVVGNCGIGAAPFARRARDPRVLRG